MRLIGSLCLMVFMYSLYCSDSWAAAEGKDIVLTSLSEHYTFHAMRLLRGNIMLRDGRGAQEESADFERRNV